MSRIRQFISLILLPFLFSDVTAQESVWHGRCVGVTDGDTIKVLTAAKQQIRVRLAFVDAPEKGQAFGQRAKQAMSELVFGKDVELLPHTIDRHGRLVARVIVDGQDAGLELLKQGLCWSTKSTSVKRRTKSRRVTATLKPTRDLKKLVSGKTLSRCRPGNGASRTCKATIAIVPVRFTRGLSAPI